MRKVMFIHSEMKKEFDKLYFEEYGPESGVSKVL